MEFDYGLEYKSGCANMVTYALTCKREVTDISHSQSNIWDPIKGVFNMEHLHKPLSTLSRRVKQGDFSWKRAWSSARV